MITQILNIEYNIGLLVLKALNKSKKIDDAAPLLGVSIRQVFFYKKHYSIVWDAQKKCYHFDKKSIMKTFTTQKPIPEKA